MKYLYIATTIVLIFSTIKDYKKTIKALKIAWKKFANILPKFLLMLILVSISLYFIPQKTISAYLGGNDKFLGLVLASIFGSITLMPGFVAYPLCGILLKKGVTYMVLSAFTTTMMMVGILSFPIEREYFGTKVALTRNIISFFIAIVIALITGIIFREILI